MRISSGGIGHVSSHIRDSLSALCGEMRKNYLDGLSDLAACVLSCRSVNTAQWQVVLPRETGDEKSKERYISRFLSNPRISVKHVMSGLAGQALSLACANGKTAVLMMDQSKISDNRECLMISLRTGERAIPVLWRVRETSGGIGFDVQEPLLDDVAAMLPEGAKVMLSADRFYGTSKLIAWCQTQGWDYRIRLKENRILHHEGGEITAGEAARARMNALTGVRLNDSDVMTHIGIIHEKGHKEPWIIAMSDTPNTAKTLDYGMRWGIESMFSDFKSRGFGITQTHITCPDRIERLILVMSVALYHAVSAGMSTEDTTETWTEKNEQEVSFLSSRKD